MEKVKQTIEVEIPQNHKLIDFRRAWLGDTILNRETGKPEIWNEEHCSHGEYFILEPVSDKNTIDTAISFIATYGTFEGEHHKSWVIDRVLRILAAEKYKEIVSDIKSGEDGPETYNWDTGVAP